MNQQHQEEEADKPGPRWLYLSPEIQYELGCYLDGGSEDLVTLTLEEFIRLKRELAKIRGLPLPEEHNGEPWPGEEGQAEPDAEGKEQ